MATDFVGPSTRDAVRPYDGADDLNSAAAVQLDGVLFLEGEGWPAEISHLIAELRTHEAMQSSWDAVLMGYGRDSAAGRRAGRRGSVNGTASSPMTGLRRA